MMKKLFFLLLMMLGGIYLLDRYIAEASSQYIYSSKDKVPTKNAALVLGTAKYMRGGGENYFYTYRIRAAMALWKAGKIKAVVVSGDNGTNYYDETTAMFKDLVKAGIPEKYITKDDAGFRTLDSVVRAEAIFELKDYIIVSQRFHLERALFIAKAKGQKAIGFVAKDVPDMIAIYKVLLRESLARVKAFLDLYVLGTEPRVYGDRVKVRYRK